VPLLTARIPKASLNHFYLLPQTHEIEKIIKESDIGVLSSVSEGFPNVVLEFMACGKPVVVSRVGGVPEMIDESMDGFLVAPKNSRELHTILDRLVKDESLRLRVGEKAKEKIQQKFPIENMIAGFQEAYSISENPTILS
jgi:glycosyltransferase involved in cell wall biosynthesis